MSTPNSTAAATLMRLLRCPACGATVSLQAASYRCDAAPCGKAYPRVDGVAIVIDESRSSLRIQQVARAQESLRAERSKGGGRRLLGSLTPALVRGVQRGANLSLLQALLPAGLAGQSRQVCVVRADPGPEPWPASGETLEFLRVAVCPGIGGVDMVCDGERLPLADGSFDAVFAADVFGCVPDPGRVVMEMQRILRPGGLLYVEARFQQQGVRGPNDFYRFSSLGLRRLCRHFEELRSGVLEGPGTALAAAWRALCWSLSDSHRLGLLLSAFGSYTAFLWKYTDRRLTHRRRALDTAASLYFIGRRSDRPLADSELLAGYAGGGARDGFDGQAIRPATEVFTQWAATGRDAAMQANHELAVAEMLDAARLARGADQRYTAIDAGCGNGWIVRLLRSDPLCDGATGVDGSAGMIAKARTMDPGGDYALEDLRTWKPLRRVRLVVSMEVIYYFDDPVALLRNVRTDWLLPGGNAVIGIDHYLESAASLRWPAGLGVRMVSWSEAAWVAAAQAAGFAVVRCWRAGVRGDEPGTLALLLQAPAADDQRPITDPVAPSAAAHPSDRATARTAAVLPGGTSPDPDTSA